MESLFSERLKTVRTQKNLTQEDIANGIASNKSTISQYENGKRKADHEMIIKVSEYLGVSADYMLGLVDDPNGKMAKKRDNILYHQLSGIIREFLSSENVPQSEKDNIFKDVNTMYWKYKK